MLTDAPAAAAIAAALIAGALWMVFTWAYQSVVTHKDAAISSQQTIITNLNSTVSDLRSEIANLRTRPADKVASPGPEAPQVVQRDPDGVYQFGRQIGSVMTARVSLETGSVTFERIYNVANLDVDKEFEYRDLTLRFRQPASETRVEMGGPPQRTLWDVVCNIVSMR